MYTTPRGLKILKARKTNPLPMRNMRVFRAPVTHLKDVALVHEVGEALLRWVKFTTTDPAPGVLIGALAMSFYRKPRTTEDVDLLFLSESNAPTEVLNFKHNSPHVFEDKKYGVEVEIFTPTLIGVPESLVKKVIDTAVEREGILVASLEGMLALKLTSAADSHSRRRKDEADAFDLVSFKPDVDMSDWDLSEGALRILAECKADLRR